MSLNASVRVPLNLRYQLWLLAGAYALASAGGYLWLSAVSPELQPTRWLAMTAAVLLFEWWILQRNLGKNHRSGQDQLLPGLGWGNGLTLTRGVGYALMGGFLVIPEPVGRLAWLPALLYTVASVLDYFDGYLARVTDHATELGETLDMEFDGLAILLAVALAIHYGRLPAWYLVLALGRPLFLLGLALRRRQGKPERPMTNSDQRRIIAGLNMGFASVVLWPVWGAPATTVAALVFGGPVAASFLRDWFVVTGLLEPHSTNYQRVFRRLHRLVYCRLPLLLRILGLSLGLWILFRSESAGRLAWKGWGVALAQDGTAAPELLLVLGGILGLLALPMVGLGILSRVGGLLLVALAANDFLATTYAWDNLGLLAIGLLLLILGNGMWALLPLDDAFVRTRAGTQPRQRLEKIS